MKYLPMSRNRAIPGMVVRSRIFPPSDFRSVFRDQTMSDSCGRILSGELCTVLAVDRNLLYVLSSASQLGWVHSSNVLMIDDTDVFVSDVMEHGWVSDEKRCEECGENPSVGTLMYQCDACMICMCISCMECNVCISSCPDKNETHMMFGCYK